MEHKEEISTQPEQQEENKLKKKNPGDSIRILWYVFKHTNIQIIGMTEGEEEEQEIKNLLEKIMKENPPNLVKEIDVQIQETQSIPNKLDPKRTTPRHSIIKMPKVKDKERILKAAREKKLVTYKGVLIRLSADFSKETLEARRDWKEISKVMKSRDLQPRLLCPAKISFRIEGQIKSFTGKEKLKELIIIKPLLYEMSKGLI